MRLEKIAYKKEPVWHNQKWAVAIYSGTGKCHYYYAKTRKEIRGWIEMRAEPGDICEIFKMDVNFVQAAERVR